jgi:very-short-patch-repair endonuclease
MKINYSKHNKCKCGKLIDARAKNCRSCSKLGKYNSNYVHGLPKCIDCGKQLSNYIALRCDYCNNKYQQDKNHPNYKDGRTKKIYFCVDCNKTITWQTWWNGNRRCMHCSGVILWKNKIFRKKLLKNSNPNKPEKALNDILIQLFNNQYYLNVKGKYVIGTKIPDFIDVKNKKIIEMFGDYWHNRPEIKLRDKRRLIEYKKFGYKTLIVWQEELKNKVQLIKKLNIFNKGI